MIAAHAITIDVTLLTDDTRHFIHFAVSIKDQPEQVRLFEIYRDTAAYDEQLQSPHLKKHKELNRNMVKPLACLQPTPFYSAHS